MTTYILLYEKFADFEIALACYLLHHKGETITVGIDKEPKKSDGQIKHVVDKLVVEVDIDDVDVLVIPGGNPDPYKDNEDLKKFIRGVNDKGALIAAICGGPGFLAHAGVITGKKITHGYGKEDGEKVFADSIITEEDVIVDGNVITAKGWAYAEFAVEIGRQLNMFKNEEEATRTLKVFKNQKPK